jgi:hypothetical protein
MVSNVFVGATLWGTLGFMRGIHSYNYNNSYSNRLYTDKVLYGLAGLFFYVNPFSSLLMLYKEFYRLEVNLFKLKIHQENDFYNNIFV